MDFVERLINISVLRTESIKEAFWNIKRYDFLFSEDRYRSDDDLPISIGYNQTNSQPFTVAFMLELLMPKKGNLILDVGCGSGWTTALLAHIVGASGRVYGLEIVNELVKFAQKNISKYNYIKSGRVKILRKNGYKGLPEMHPFDRIIVSASTPQIPTSLIEQLKVGGRMVIPVGENNQTQSIAVIDKMEQGEIKKKYYPGFIFVPLIDKN